MKKYFGLFLLLIPLLADAQINDRLQIIQNEFSVVKQDGYDKIYYQEGYTSEIGKPELPVVSRSFVIPTDAAVTHLDVVVENETMLTGTYFVYPVQPPIKLPNDNVIKFVNPDSTYYKNIPYPQNAATIASDVIIQGYHIVTINYYPFMYLPAKKELYLREISVTIQYNMDEKQIENPPISYYRAELAKGFVKSFVQNPSDVDFYSDISNVIPQSLLLNKDVKNPKTRMINVLEEIVPDYVIITCDSLKSSFKRLADWKTKKGIPTIIQTVEVINNEYAGSDLAEKIRNYLLDAKKRWNGNSLFVLLGGDINIVPTRIYSSKKLGTDAYFVADKFQLMPQVNGNIVSSDCITSSFLGRMPVKNRYEANNLVNKVISYEKASESGVDYSYFNNSLATAAFILKEEKEGPDGKPYYCYSAGFRGNIYSYCKNRTNKYRFLFDHYNCTKNDHEADTAYHDVKNAEEFNKANFVSAITNANKPGYNNLHFIFHNDHCVTSALGTSSKDKGENLDNNEVDNAAFQKHYYQVYMSMGCYPADFYRDCIAEHLLNKEDAGAVAFLGNADTGWGGETIKLNRFLDAAFSTNVSSPGQYSMGYLQQAALYDFGDQYECWLRTSYFRYQNS